MVEVKNLLNDITVAIIDNIRRAIGFRDLNTFRTGTDREKTPGAMQRSARNRHQADRTDPDNNNRIAKFNAGKLDAMEPGRDL